MKNIIHILILFPFFCSGQIQYFTNGTQWRVTSSWAENPNCIWTSEIQYYLNSDSVINGNNYYKLYSKTDTRNFFNNPSCSGQSGFAIHFIGLIRQDSLKVYLYNYFGNQKDTLLFDFSLSVGSVISDPLFPASTLDTIKSIDSILVGNEYRKRFWTGNFNPHVEFLIEGIGHNGGLLQPYNSCIGCSSQLNCFYNDSMATAIHDASKCNLDLSLRDDLDLPFSIYPNPASSFINIKPNKSSPYEYTLFDISGRKLINKTADGETRIQLDGIEQSIVILKIVQDQNIFIERILVKSNH